MRGVKELDQIWDGICSGTFSGEYKPEKVFHNENIQIMYIPAKNGSEYEVYERGRAGEWKLLPPFMKQA
jgi:hypothetical protein